MSYGITQPLEKQYQQLLRMDPQAILQSSASEFLKIAAIKAQQEARQAPAQQPQNTVAEQVVQQSMSPSGGMGLPSVLPTPAQAVPVPPRATPPMPQMAALDQGIGGLPADMTMASGGIVSFAEGGRGAEKRKELEERTAETKKFLMGTGDIREYYPGYSESLFMPTPTPEYEKRVADIVGPEEMSSADMYYATPADFRYQKNRPVAPGAPAPESESVEELADRFGVGIGAGVDGGRGTNLPTLKPTPLPEYVPYVLKETFDRDAARKKAIEGIGGLPDYYNEQRKALAEQTGELQKLRRLGTSEALVSAGQAIANAQDMYGRPQTTLGAITEGLGAFTQSRQAANREIRAEERLNRKLESELATLEYAEKRGDVDAATAAAEKVLNAKADVDKFNYVSRSQRDLEATKLAQQTDIAKYGAQSRLAVAELNQSRADARALLKVAAATGANTAGIDADKLAARINDRLELLMETDYEELVSANRKMAEERGRVPNEEELRSNVRQALYNQAVQQIRSEISSAGALGFTQQPLSE
jgi:hypothetical protein